MTVELVASVLMLFYRLPGATTALARTGLAAAATHASTLLVPVPPRHRP